MYFNLKQNEITKNTYKLLRRFLESRFFVEPEKTAEADLFEKKLQLFNKLVLCLCP
jgi:hypothetical protein